MTTISSRPMRDTWFNRAAYRAGTRFFALPDTIEKSTKRFVAANPNAFARHVIKPLGMFAAKYLTPFEITDITRIGGQNRYFNVPKPAIGTVILWLYMGCILPRALRAYYRGTQNGGDYREVFDVLRRDMVAISLFVFAVDPLTKGLNLLKRKWDGLEIVDRTRHQMLTYRQFDNYILKNEQVLIRILEEGNGKGLLNAVREMLHERGLTKKVTDPQILEHVRALKKLFPKIVTAHEQFLKSGSAEHQELRAQLAKEIISHIRQGDALTQAAYEAASHGGSLKMYKEAVRLQEKGGFAGIVRAYAKTRRSPADLVAFAFVAFLLGWFPVWFNSLWNRKNFEKKVAAEHMKPVARPQPVFQAMPGAFGTIAPATQAFNPFMR